MKVFFNELFIYTAQKMKFSIEDFFSKCYQICRKLRIWSHLLKKSFMENFIFCAVLAEINKFRLCDCKYLKHGRQYVKF